jgi:hypothetical protein
VDACALSADWEAERSKKGDPPGVFITADPKTNKRPVFLSIQAEGHNY